MIVHRVSAKQYKTNHWHTNTWRINQNNEKLKSSIQLQLWIYHKGTHFTKHRLVWLIKLILNRALSTIFSVDLLLGINFSTVIALHFLKEEFVYLLYHWMLWHQCICAAGISCFCEMTYNKNRALSRVCNTNFYCAVWKHSMHLLWNEHLWSNLL